MQREKGGEGEDIEMSGERDAARDDRSKVWSRATETEI